MYRQLACACLCVLVSSVRAFVYVKVGEIQCTPTPLPRLSHSFSACPSVSLSASLSHPHSHALSGSTNPPAGLGHGVVVVCPALGVCRADSARFKWRLHPQVRRSVEYSPACTIVSLHQCLHIHIQIHVHVCVCVHVCACVCVFVCVCVCECVVYLDVLLSVEFALASTRKRLMHGVGCRAKGHLVYYVASRSSSSDMNVAI